MTAVIVHFTAHFAQSRYSLILWFDAAGMALVTIAGAAKAAQMGVGPVVAVAMGVVTATVGGIIRDVLGQEPSVILRQEIYVTASLIGAISCVGSLGLGDPPQHWLQALAWRWPSASVAQPYISPGRSPRTSRDLAKTFSRNQPLRGHC